VLQQRAHGQVHTTEKAGAVRIDVGSWLYAQRQGTAGYAKGRVVLWRVVQSPSSESFVKADNISAVAIGPR